jgi:hypothetical protein
MKGAGRRAALVAAVAAVAVACLPEAARACATCYGAADAPMTEGMNNAILFLLGCVGVVFAGVVSFIWDIHRRIAQRERRFRLLAGGAR